MHSIATSTNYRPAKYEGVKCWSQATIALIELYEWKYSKFKKVYKFKSLLSFLLFVYFVLVSLKPSFIFLFFFGVLNTVVDNQLLFITISFLAYAALILFTLNLFVGFAFCTSWVQLFALFEKTLNIFVHTSILSSLRVKRYNWPFNRSIFCLPT